MADSDLGEQGDEFTIDTLPKDLLKCEKPITSNGSQNPSSNGWSMVIIKDCQECSIVFPPIHHENLPLKPSIFTEQLQKPPCVSLTPSLSSSSSSSTLSALSAENDDESNDSSSSPFSSMGFDKMVSLESPALSSKRIARPSAGVLNRLYVRLEVLLRKVKGVLYLFPFQSKAAFTVAMLLGYLYFRRRRRPVVQEQSKDHFNRIIREKDERINQLLHQIARMNEVILALPKNSAINN